MGRILGVDYGTKRIGVAVSDDDQVFAFELDIFPSDSFLETYPGLVKEHGIERTVLGNPIGLDGSNTETTARAAIFQGQLKAAAPDVPVELVDERFSSQFAQGFIRKKKQQKPKRGIDSLAAQVILENYLEVQRNKKLSK